MEITVNDITYKIGRLTAKEQFHLVRRLAPVVPALTRILSEEEMDEGKLLTKLVWLFSHMDDPTADYIIDTCLSAVQRKQQQGLGWANVLAPGGLLMFEDISMREMLTLTFAVIKHNVSDFFAVLLSGLTAGINPKA